MKSMSGYQAVGGLFFVLAIVWFLTGRSALGATFLAVGAVFLAIDQQKK